MVLRVYFFCPKQGSGQKYYLFNNKAMILFWNKNRVVGQLQNSLLFYH